MPKPDEPVQWQTYTTDHTTADGRSFSKVEIWTGDEWIVQSDEETT